jgi:misacylated tRNA(Ala) deacylase
MTHHTAQHLLSALLDSLPNPIPTLSWSLTPSPSPCYIEVPRAPTPEEIASVEKRANELIRVGTRVFVEVDDQARKEKEEMERAEREGRVSNKAIPKDYEGGVVRTIVVEGVDRNA